MTHSVNEAELLRRITCHPAIVGTTRSSGIIGQLSSLSWACWPPVTRLRPPFKTTVDSRLTIANKRSLNKT